MKMKYFMKMLKVSKNEREGKARCPVCFRVRLDYTARKAKELNLNILAQHLL